MVPCYGLTPPWRVEVCARDRSRVSNNWGHRINLLEVTGKSQTDWSLDMWTENLLVVGSRARRLDDRTGGIDNTYSWSKEAHSRGVSQRGRRDDCPVPRSFWRLGPRGRDIEVDCIRQEKSSYEDSHGKLC